MNQIIKTDVVDFVALVNSDANKTFFSAQFNSKLVDKLKTEFTEEQQRWFFANFYMYMNYHPTNDYPIDLENIYALIGFANKGNAKSTLENNFTKDEDYKITIKNKSRLLAKEEILLNTETFKNMCMLSKSDTGKKIRKYYVKLENITDFIKEQQTIK